MKGKQLQIAYYNIESEVINYFHELVESEELIEFDQEDNQLLDYINSQTGTFEECILVSIDSAGAIMVIDNDLETYVETTIEDYTIKDILKLIELVENYKFDKV